MASATPTPETDLTRYAGRWLLDPDRTTITFRTKAMWVMPVKGTIRASEGSGEIGSDGSVSGHLVLDAKTVETGIKKRDAHLQTADFFHTEEHPTIDFEVTGARPVAAGRVALEGTLRILGNTKPFVFEGDVQADTTEATFNGEVDIDRSRWGLDFTKMGAGLGNKVSVSAILRRA